MKAGEIYDGFPLRDDTWLLKSIARDAQLLLPPPFLTRRENSLSQGQRPKIARGRMYTSVLR